MLKIRNIGLPNILLDTDYFTELIQKDCNITNILEASEKIPDMRLNNAVIEEKLKNIY